MQALAQGQLHSSGVAGVEEDEEEAAAAMAGEAQRYDAYLPGGGQHDGQYGAQYGSEGAGSEALDDVYTDDEEAENHVGAVLGAGKSPWPPTRAGDRQQPQLEARNLQHGRGDYRQQGAAQYEGYAAAEAHEGYAPLAPASRPRTSPLKKLTNMLRGRRAAAVRPPLVPAANAGPLGRSMQEREWAEAAARARQAQLQEHQRGAALFVEHSAGDLEY
jgi:hypothetical protein